MNRCFSICTALKIAFFFCKPTLIREEDDKLNNPTEVEVQYRSSEIYVRPDMGKTVSETTL